MFVKVLTPNVSTNAQYKKKVVQLSYLKVDDLKRRNCRMYFLANFLGSNSVLHDCCIHTVCIRPYVICFYDFHLYLKRGIW